MFIHAVNIHGGGGRTLLSAVMEALRGKSVVFQVDARFALPPPDPSWRIVSVEPTVAARLSAEFRLRRETAAGEVVLCLGNLPPLFPLRGRVFVFLQNRYLFGDRDLSGFPLRARLRLNLERAWFGLCGRRGAEIVVQTRSMAEELRSSRGLAARVLPFAPIPASTPRESIEGERVDFIYVASGEPHKNHRRLIEAWEILARDGIRPSLRLTLDPDADADLSDWVERRAAALGLDVASWGRMGSEELARRYRRARALIYPSLFESFGLPLIEADRAGLPVVGAERDYTRDVVVPAQTFDPESAVSIARAVGRFLGRAETPPPVRSAGEFLDALTGAS